MVDYVIIFCLVDFHDIAPPPQKHN